MFGGTRSAKELENFIWDVEQYLKDAHIPDEEKVSITSMYLTGDMKCSGGPVFQRFAWDNQRSKCGKAGRTS
jgi:hypothetical protein